MKVGSIVKDSKGKRFEVIKIWRGGYIDVQCLNPYYDRFPTYKPELLSERIEDYEVLKDEKTEQLTKLADSHY